MMVATPMSERVVVEAFHLELLRLLASGSQKAHYAVKGGCNLRFFFGSVRYSEDLDLDIHVTAKTTLEKQVDAVLDSQALERLLRAHGIAIEGWSKPKQTETTQRWKIGLRSAGRALGIHTKVEFSRRGAADLAVLEPVDRTLLAEHRVAPFNARHYD